MLTLAAIALILVIIGALNWGLVGVMNYNLVSALFGENSKVSKAIYALVGIAGVYSIFLFTRVMPCAAGPR